MLYADINSDGVIDHVQSIPEKPKSARKKRRNRDTDTCIAFAASASQYEVLFEKSVCTNPFSFFSLGLDKISNKERDNIDMANPTWTYSDTGHDRINSIFLISTGKVSALSPEGELLWQADTGKLFSLFLFILCFIKFIYL